MVIALLAIAGRAAAMNLNTDPTLVVWYKFNQVGDTTVTDNSPAGDHDGTLSGKPPSYLSAANQFASGGGDFVPTSSGIYTTSDDADLTPSSVTVALWFNADTGSTAWMTFVSKRDGSPFPGYCVRPTNAKVLHTSGWAVDYRDVSTAFSSTGSWHHVAMVSDGIGTPTYLYLNGAEIGTADSTPTSGLTNTSADLSLGGQPSNARYFDAKIADFRIYSRALDATEVDSCSARHTFPKGRSC